MALELQYNTTRYIQSSLESGLDFILSHDDVLWPRMISTYKTGQYPVYDFREAITQFYMSKLLNARISAHPIYTDYYIHHTGRAPSVILVDIDREHFDNNNEEFELAAAKTYSKCKEILGSDFEPTQLWTGNGYHFIIRLDVCVFEKLEGFKKFKDPSVKFMRWLERLLSDYKADPAHSNTVSLDNCLLRIPGSLNASRVQFDNKQNIINILPEAYVRIVKRWNRIPGKVGNSLMMDFYVWLQAEEIKAIEHDMVIKAEYRAWRKKYGSNSKARELWNLQDYGYIEKLINKPIETHRNHCVWRIFVPYYVNVKRLPKSQVFDIVKSWLDKCDSISRLDFDATRKIEYTLDHVDDYRPTRQYQLKDEHPRLYALLQKEGIIH